MSNIRQQRREALRERLLVAASQRIANDGLRSLRMRDLAKDAGCALGAIYNIFTDMQELLFQANIRVFLILGKEVADAVEAVQDQSPHDRMVTMSLAYYDFAVKNTNAWQALFELDVSETLVLPDWYIQALRKLMGYISIPVQQIRPELSPEENSMITRSLFSAVHGVVDLSVAKRPSGLKPKEIPQAIDFIIRSFK